MLSEREHPDPRPRDHIARNFAPELAAIAHQIFALKGEVHAYLTDPDYSPLRLRTENARRQRRRPIPVVLPANSPLASSSSTRALCSSDSWDSDMCRSEPLSRLPVIEGFYFVASVLVCPTWRATANF